MTRDLIIFMAHEANRYANNQTDAEGYEWHLIRDERFANLIAAAERESVIDICEKWAKSGGDYSLLDAIRARGQE